MPEAVIVATARSPIGRAFKGSLVDLRPDDMAAQIVAGRAGQGARPRSDDHRRPDPRLRPARRRAGVQHGPGGGRAGRPARRARRHRHPLLLVVAADHPDGGPRHPGRRGRRVCRRRGRGGEPLRQGQLGPLPDTENPAFAGAKERSAAAFAGRRSRCGRRPRDCPTCSSPWARRPKTSASWRG